MVERREAWRMQRISINSYSQMAQLSDVKKTNPEYSEVGSQVLQEVLERLDKAYKAFFRRINNGEKVGYPRFKGKERYDSFTLKKQGWKINGKYLTISNIGRFKLRLSRPIQGNIKTITIKREQSSKWYACFSCDNVPEKKLMESGNVIGLDVGIKSFLVDSDGNSVDNPNYFRKSERQLIVRQRRLARRKMGSRRRNKARILVAKLHERVKNQRSDFLHKLANEYLAKYGTICVEDLNIKGMVKNHHLAKSISDAGWGQFIGLIEYKAVEAGRQLIRIPRFEPSSKTCSECGTINQDLKLSNRTWVCKSCGTAHDRDNNAAKNIRRVGQTLQEQTYAVTQSVS
jgi:putative transposase